MSPILQSLANASAFGFRSTGPVLATPSFESISTVTVGAGGTSSIDFTSIPGTYSHLQIRAIIRDTTSGTSLNNLSHRLNGDTASNYYVHRIYGDNASAFAGTPGNPATNLNSLFYTASNGYTTGLMAPAIWDIYDYANTNKKKVVRSFCGGSAHGSGLVLFNSGLWNSTDAVTSISIYGATFVQYTQVALYGVKAAA